MLAIARQRILVVNYSMVFGGVEKACLSLLAALPPDRFDVTLLLVSKTGAYLEQIPSWVTVKELALHPDDRHEMIVGRRAALIQSLKRGKLIRVLRSLIRRAYCMGCVARPLWRCVEFDAMLDRVHFDDTEYDCAISYSDSLVCVAIVAERIDSRRRLVWFHGDFPDQHIRQENYQHYYRKYDRLFAVSSALVDKLNSRIPSLPRPVELFPHIIDPSDYAAKAAAGKGFTDVFTGLRILSVGRLSEQKGFDLAVEVHARLIRAGYPVRWYVVGGGHAENSLRDAIQSAGVQDSFMLLGQDANPYPYFAQCDIYVQPSRYEGYCLTIAEARAFFKPIVCTDFAGAREQIVDGETGLIVPCEVDAIYQAVKRLLDTSALRQTFSRNLSRSQIGTIEAARRLAAVIAGDDEPSMTGSSIPV